MTPREVYAAIDAANWRDQNRFELATYVAWRTAGYIRSKDMPKSFKHVLDPPKTKALTPEEAKVRRAEYEKMVKALPKRFRS